MDIKERISSVKNEAVGLLQDIWGWAGRNWPLTSILCFSLIFGAWRFDHLHHINGYHCVTNYPQLSSDPNLRILAARVNEGILGDISASVFVVNIAENPETWVFPFDRQWMALPGYPQLPLPDSGTGSRSELFLPGYPDQNIFLDLGSEEGIGCASINSLNVRIDDGKISLDR